MIEALRGKDIVDISLGSVHCLALTREGKVYAWGGNDKGQLGISNCESKDVPTAVGGIDGTSFQYVACGPAQVYLLFLIAVFAWRVCRNKILWKFPVAWLKSPDLFNFVTPDSGATILFNIVDK